MGKSDKILAWGCGLLILVVLLAACCIAVVVGLPMKHFSGPDSPYSVARNYLTNHPILLEEIGPEPEIGRIPMGSVQINNGGGKADLGFTVEGTLNQGKANVVLRKESGGEWEVVEAQLVVDDRTIPLMDAPDPAPEPVEEPQIYI